MKKFFLVLFLGFFLFSCNNEIDENINSGSNENQNLENNEEVANLKITAGFKHDFEVDSFGISLGLIFTNGHNIFHNGNNVYEVWNKFRNEAKNDLYERKEIFKEFPDLEKNLTDSEEKIDGFEFYTRLEAGTSLEAEEKPWNKMSLKIDGNYNPDFKGNLYNFPFYSYYCPHCQDLWYTDILTAKNTGKNTYSIEKTENNMMELFAKKLAVSIGTHNHTFEKIPEKIFIDFASISEIYKKYPKEKKYIRFTINYGKIVEIEKIEYNDGKIIDFNDNNCEEYSSGDGFYCLDLAKILENEDIENITIYTKNIK